MEKQPSKAIQQVINAYQSQLINEDQVIHKQKDLTQTLEYKRINWQRVLMRHLKEQKDIKKALAITYKAHAERCYRNAVLQYGHNYRVAVVDGYTQVVSPTGKVLFKLDDLLMLLGTTVQFVIGSKTSQEFVETSLHIDWSKDFAGSPYYSSLEKQVKALFTEYITQDKLLLLLDSLKTSKFDQISDVISFLYLCLNKYCKSFIKTIPKGHEQDLVLIANFYLLGHLDIDGTFIYYPFSLEDWQKQFLIGLRDSLLL